jgi:hypothetical protein
MAQTNRSADAAIFRSLDGRGSMTSPPGDMTETPYRGGRIGSGWRRSGEARRIHHGARISGVQTRRKADFVDTRRTCQYRTKFLGTRSSCDGPGALFLWKCLPAPVASATCRLALLNRADRVVCHFVDDPLDDVSAAAALGAAAEVVIDLTHPQPLRRIRKRGPKLMVTEYIARANDHDLS